MRSNNPFDAVSYGLTLTVLLVRMNKNTQKRGMEGMNTNNWIITAIAALVIIIGGGWLVARERAGSMVSEEVGSSTDTTSSSSEVMTNEKPEMVSGASLSATPSVQAGGETVTVADQSAAEIVKVSNVTLSKPSWVAIKGTNGWVLGAAWFNASTENATVSLVKPMVKGETYQAVIYVDDGDKKFSLHAGDSLVTDASGAPVSSTFKAQ